MDPGHVEAWVSLAAEYGSRGRIDEAFRCIREAARRNPRARGVQISLGNLFDLSGKADSAEAAYRREIDSHPESDEARVSLADMRLRAGDEAEATRLYRDVLAHGAFPVRDLIDHARQLRESSLGPRSSLPWDRSREGLSLASGILTCLHGAGARLDPRSERDLVDMELLLGRFDRARRAYEDVSGDSDVAPFGTILDVVQNAPGATDAGARAWAGDRAAADEARGLADFYNATGRPALAIPIWRALLHGGLLSPDELNHVAVTTLRGGAIHAASPRNAEEIWTMLLDEKPDQPLALLNLGGIALTAGDRAACRARWSRFLALYPDRPEAADVREKLARL